MDGNHDVTNAFAFVSRNGTYDAIDWIYESAETPFLLDRMRSGAVRIAEHDALAFFRHDVGFYMTDASVASLARSVFRWPIVAWRTQLNHT